MAPNVLKGNVRWGGELNDYKEGVLERCSLGVLGTGSPSGVLEGSDRRGMLAKSAEIYAERSV